LVAQELENVAAAMAQGDLGARTARKNAYDSLKKKLSGKDITTLDLATEVHNTPHVQNYARMFKA
jgi:hypothetical protein